MSLATALEAKKIARRALLYSHWPCWMRDCVKNSARRLNIAALMALRGISLSSEGGKAVVSCKGRRVIVPESDAKDPERLATIVCSFGRFFSIAGLEHDGREIDVTGELSLCGYSIRTECGMLLEAGMMGGYNKHSPLKRGDVVVDAGAYHGIYAILSSRAVGNDGRIYCFEPDQKNAKVLEGNLERNGIENVELVKKGLWREDGAIPFLQRNSATSQAAFGTEGSPARCASTVGVVSLPSFFEKEGLKRLDFVKMDIEGAEIEAVEGCAGFLERHPASFGIASYHLRDGTETYHRLEGLFEGMGYRHETEITDTIITYAWPKKK
jgi:FkbM family methyltransferase